MLRRTVFLGLCSVLLLGVGRDASAALYDVSLSTGDVSFSPPELILGTVTRIYATIVNDGERDVEGTIRFYDGDTLIGAKAYSLRAALRPEDAWVRWTPDAYGAHTIRVVAENDDQFRDAAPGNNTVSLPIFIDRDTDGDGVPDQADEDQDNDLILNADETARGTNPLRADSDGDGVNDRLDAFPLDRSRTVVPPPTPAPVVRPTQPAVTPRRVTVAPAPVQQGTGIVATATTTSLQAPLVVESTTTTVVPVAAMATASASAPADPVPVEVVASPAPVESSDGFSWSALLVAAAVISAVAAGSFIWLGRRS